MDALPGMAEFGQMSHQIDNYPGHLVAAKSVILPQLRRTLGAVQVEDRFAVRADNVDVGRSMIVRINRHAQATETQDRKSTRLNSSHANISYAVFCLKKKNS